MHHGRLAQTNFVSTVGLRVRKARGASYKVGLGRPCSSPLLVTNIEKEASLDVEQRQYDMEWPSLCYHTWDVMPITWNSKGPQQPKIKLLKHP